MKGKRLKDKDMHNDLRAHAVLLPGGCLSFIALTRGISEDIASKLYPPGCYTVLLASPEHFELLKGYE